MECIDVGNRLELIAVFLDEMSDNWLDVFPPDIFEQFKACRIQEVVARHCFKDNVKNKAENVVMSELGQVERILQIDQGLKKLECG